MPFRKFTLLLALALMLTACEGPSLTTSSHVRPELTEAERKKFEQYLATANRDAKKGKAVSTRTYVRYEMPDGNEHIYITRSGHPAHPAVIRRTIISRKTTRKLATRGNHAGDRRAFEQWLAEFKALDVNQPASAGLKPIPVL